MSSSAERAPRPGSWLVELASVISSSSSSSTRSARAATCCFSRATLTTRGAGARLQEERARARARRRSRRRSARAGRSSGRQGHVPHPMAAPIRHRADPDPRPPPTTASWRAPPAPRRRRRASRAVALVGVDGRARRAGRRCSARSRSTPGRRGSAGTGRGACPSASASTALITSPWLTATQTASGPVLRLDRRVVAGVRRPRRAPASRPATRRRGTRPPTAAPARCATASPWPGP